MEKQKEHFSSRLGFILIAAGCAIGVGNVYKFPIWTGAYGGGIFLLFYLIFLIILGIPVMCAELAVGRASQKSIASSFKQLEKPGQKWHFWQYGGIIGNYALMMCYTPLVAWFILYFFNYLTGNALQAGTTSAELMTFFANTLPGNPGGTLIATYIAVIVGLGTCAFGLQKGVEKITKVMMVCLFALITGLAIYSLTLPGTREGLTFYFVPSAERASAVGWGTVISKAMQQAFFTLSLGIGSIAIFGAGIGRERSLLGESVTIIGLDTFVALMAGLFIFPAYFTYNPGTEIAGSQGGPVFLFTTFASVFNNMPGGRILGILFFLFMCFAALSTVIAVMENIVNFWLEKTNLKRSTICLINFVSFLVLVLPAVFAMTSVGVFGTFSIKGIGTVDSFLDWLVSNLALPIGCMIYSLFCCQKFGWGWDNFYAEVNAGQGARFPAWAKNYMKYVLPVIIFVVLILSLV